MKKMIRLSTSVCWFGKGVLRSRASIGLFVHDCRTEAAAHKVFTDVRVPHYWDLDLNFKDEEFLFLF